MSASGGGDIVHGAGLPSPRWWRRYRDIPLIILAVLSLIAALVGWVTQYRLDEAAAQPAAFAPAPGADDGTFAACGPEAAVPDEQPWIDDAAASEQVWAANADSLDEPVVLGQDGWAFYNDQVEESFSQAVGRRYLTVGEVGAWHDYFSTLAEALDAQGIEFSIQIIPSASTIYPEQLPEWTAGIVGSTPLDQFLAASSDLPVVDFRHDLRAAAASDAVFTPVNSHWTDWGGYVAWETYAACRDATNAADTPFWVPAIDAVESTRVYNEYAAYGVPDAEPAWTVPDFAEDFADVEVVAADGSKVTIDGSKPMDYALLPASTTTEAAKTSAEALILRDSMGNALTPYWGQEFAKTRQELHRYDDWSTPPNYRALVDQYQPDIVIVQLAERHLVNAPPAGVGTGY
ncbi:hypothetical protein R8Z57_11370 [Microbacterium sp. M3]|uniref:AlgX/AlgJ SGNH hydrolase-like domain-containing protein n=1 Tax=Microbacterium arthrosphaerae TaxID=792652 RepID=A0ABU4H216_9MICO|nr:MULTISPECIES: hypothetical protein [Microbacterium]MDW4573371.1 hypothetical protein [Microbacterium arthrosphaerae]MDW7607226.1 hypothetical protein [Microbacterium sp. M3]